MEKRKPAVKATEILVPVEPTRIHVRWMIRMDMKEVMEIESANFGKDAWGEEDFLCCLRQINCIGMVAERGPVVQGFMVYELNKHRLDIANFSVCPKAAKSGVGLALMEKLKRKLSAHRRRRITVSVPERYLGSLMFFKRMGFLATGIVRGGAECEDAIVMRYTMPSSEEFSEEAPLYGDGP